MMSCTGRPRTGDDVADGEAVADVILELVKTLGMDKKLGEYGVGRDQVDVITGRATGNVPGDLAYEAVKSLVEGLF